MKSKMNIYYDEEGDFLEIGLDGRRNGYFVDVGEGISKRIDEKTGKIIGIAILSFRKRTEHLKDIKISLPVKLQMN